MSTKIPSLDKINQFTQVVRDNPKTAVLAVALLATLVVSSIFLKISYEAQDYLFFIYGGLAITCTVGLIVIASACVSALRKEAKFAEMYKGARRAADLILGISSDSTLISPSNVIGSSTTSSSTTASVSVKKSSLPTSKTKFEALYRQKLSESPEAFGEWIAALYSEIMSYNEHQMNILTSTFTDGTTILFGWTQHYFEYVKTDTPPPSSTAFPYAFFLRNLVTRMKNLNASAKAKAFLEHRNRGLNCVSAITNKALQEKVRLRWQSAINNLEN